MKSLKNLYRYGPGPSSSHTIAPFAAASRFASLIGKEDPVRVTFYGSLAHSFRGHHSDAAIFLGLGDRPTTIYLDTETEPPHPLTMLFESKGLTHVYYSLGGGALYSETDPYVNEKDVYPFANFDEFKEAYAKSNKALPEFIASFEDGDILEYLDDILHKMFDSVEKGLNAKGKIPANDNPRLQLERSAADIHAQSLITERGQGRRELLLSSFGYAVAEGSACGETVITAPTCGSSGVLPACLYYAYTVKNKTWEALVESLLIAGIIGTTVKQNASIAGSVGGCQAEIGTAACMGAAALSYLAGLSLHQIEYGAEVAMEHFLGLTCDPVDGYVIIPCIERNGIGAIRAYNSFLYAKYIEPIRKNQVSFDDVVKAMKITGDNIDVKYRETGLGGLATILKKKKEEDE